jgi:hypothetical protein
MHCLQTAVLAVTQFEHTLWCAPVDGPAGADGWIAHVDLAGVVEGWAGLAVAAFNRLAGASLADTRARTCKHIGSSMGGSSVRKMQMLLCHAPSWDSQSIGLQIPDWHTQDQARQT